MILYEMKFDAFDLSKGIFAVSLVDDPAIEVPFIKLSKEKELDVKLSLNEDKKIVCGPVLIPDKRIYRSAESLNSTEDGEIFFSADTIYKLSEQFLAQLRNNNITLDHQGVTEDCTLLESWIIEDSEKDKSSIYGFKLPIGTWMMSQKIHSDDLWLKIKAGDYNGYSIEALLGSIIVQNSKNEDLESKWAELIKEFIKIIE